MIEIRDEDLTIVVGCEAVHPDRRGGQHVAKQCTGVLVIHQLSGIGVMCNVNRSQYGNRAGAMEMLRKLIAKYGDRS
jgi:protein subunit release factor B